MTSQIDEMKPPKVEPRSTFDRILSRVTVAAFVITALSLTGVVAGDTGPADDLIETISSHSEQALVVSPAQSVEDALPTVSHEGIGRLSDLAIAAEFVSIEPGKSFRWEFDNSVDEGTERRIEVPFDSKDAMANTYHLTVRVESSLDERGRSTSAELVRIGISARPGSNIRELAASVSERGSIFALLRADSAVYAYDESLMAVAGNGTWLGFVGGDGVVTFPALEEEGGRRAFNQSEMKVGELLASRS